MPHERKGCLGQFFSGFTGGRRLTRKVARSKPAKSLAKWSKNSEFLSKRKRRGKL